jgi:hypothetical protein
VCSRPLPGGARAAVDSFDQKRVEVRMSGPSPTRQPKQRQRADPRRSVTRTAMPVTTVRVLPPIQRLQRAAGNRGMGRFLRGLIQTRSLRDLQRSSECAPNAATS